MALQPTLRYTVSEYLTMERAAAERHEYLDGYVYAITFGRCQTDVDNQADEPFSRLYRMVPKD